MSGRAGIGKAVCTGRRGSKPAAFVNIPANELAHLRRKFELDPFAITEGTKEDFECAICYNTLSLPLTLPCGHTFDLECLAECCNRRPAFPCPMCRTNTSKALLRTSNVDATKWIAITQMQFKCTTGECMWRGTLTDARSHAITCMHTPVPCDNAGCKVVTTRQDHLDHAESCPFRMEICGTCFHPFARNSGHFPNKCPEVRTRCIGVDCTVHERRWIVDAHMKSCPRVVVTCTHTSSNGVRCFVKAQRRFMDDHKLHRCKYRKVCCTQCDVNFEAHEIDEHTELFCDHRAVNCPHMECTWHGKAKDLAAHKKDACMFEPVPCKFADVGCTWIGTRTDFAAHSKDAAEWHAENALKWLGRLQNAAHTVNNFF